MRFYSSLIKQAISWQRSISLQASAVYDDYFAIGFKVIFLQEFFNSKK
jgi:hypothetical protein